MDFRQSLVRNVPQWITSSHVQFITNRRADFTNENIGFIPVVFFPPFLLAVVFFFLCSEMPVNECDLKSQPLSEPTICDYCLKFVMNVLFDKWEMSPIDGRQFSDFFAIFSPSFAMQSMHSYAACVTHSMGGEWIWGNAGTHDHMNWLPKELSAVV